jgi:two-component system cell cycle sensor histidine kinase/response regulator CckA
MAAQRAKDLVQRILTFSRHTAQERRPTQLHLLIKEVIALLRASLPSTIEIQKYLARDMGHILADPTQIHQVVMNLCTDAAHAMHDTGGVLEIRLDGIDVDANLAASLPPLHPGAHVRLTVRDTGHGMTPEVVKRIFEPFFTTKEPGEGTGMGLAVVHGIIAAHEGAITVESRPGHGTTFVIYLPQIATTTDSEAPRQEPTPTGTERILLVDDEAALPILARLS